MLTAPRRPAPIAPKREFLRAEVERARSRVESAQLRSPIAGIVATPVLKMPPDEHLDAGATFAQVLDLSSAVVDVSVAQGDIFFWSRAANPPSLSLTVIPSARGMAP